MTSAFGDQKVPMMTAITNVGEGWHPLIRDLEVTLNKIDPDFLLQQVKEKFGGLRYYAQISTETTATDGTYVAFQGAISEAEEASTHICEVCGAPGETLPGQFGWLKTLCPTHQDERLAGDKAMADELKRMDLEQGGEG